jgi:hypothetical protein
MNKAALNPMAKQMSVARLSILNLLRVRGLHCGGDSPSGPVLRQSFAVHNGGLVEFCVGSVGFLTQVIR